MTCSLVPDARQPSRNSGSSWPSPGGSSAIALRRSSARAPEKPTLGDLHGLLLVQDDAVRRADDRLQYWEAGPTSGCACRARRWGSGPSPPGGTAALSATRSSNSVGRTLRRASCMPSDSNWNTPTESPRASISYGPIVERQRRHVRPPPRGALDDVQGVLDDVEVAQTQEVHLQEPEPRPASSSTASPCGRRPPPCRRPPAATGRCR